jgi:hypothetical protein
MPTSDQAEISRTEDRPVWDSLRADLSLSTRGLPNCHARGLHWRLAIKFESDDLSFPSLETPYN